MIHLLFLFFVATSFDDALRAGLQALQRGDLPVAERSLEEASKLQPANGRVWVALAQVYMREERLAEGRAAATKAQSFAAKDPVVAQTLDLFYQQLLRDQKYGQVIELLKPFDDAQSRLEFGVACYGLRRFDDAAAAFLRVIELGPEVQQPYLFLGKFLDQIPARLPAIAKKFEQFAAAHPADYHSYHLLAKVRLPEAESLLRRALALDSSDPAVHFDLGSLLDNQKRFAEAALEFEASSKLNPADADAHYRLARVYDRLGKPEAARSEREHHARLVRSQDAAR